jgi:hypothetical protein
MTGLNRKQAITVPEPTEAMTGLNRKQAITVPEPKAGDNGA